jgi:hypothetical protein
MQQISLHAGNDVSKILIGNKSDMSADRQVSYEEGEYLAGEYKIPFIETSALNNVNVEEAVNILAGDVIDKMNQKKVCIRILNLEYYVLSNLMWIQFFINLYSLF